MLVGLGVGLFALAAGSAVMAADSNFSAWKAAMSDRGGRATQVVTEQNFDRFTAMHQAVVDGKYDEAQKIRTELGLGQGRGNGAGGRKGGCGASGGCAMRNGGTGTGFVDVNKNGICDTAEQLTK